MRTPLSTFWAQRKAGLVDDAEQVFDTTVSTLGELKTRGVVPWGRLGTPRCGEVVLSALTRLIWSKEPC